MSKAVRWQSWDGEGLEHMVFSDRPKGAVAEGALLSGGDARFAARYELTCHPDGRVAEAHVAVVGGPSITLQSDGDGLWRNSDGKRVPALVGASDVDLSASPVTNMLAIRRLNLAEGQSQEITAVYVRFPDLEITLDRQRYTCLQAGRRYLYEAVDGTFRTEIETEEGGLVALYPGLFRRVP
ncbi:putative glycolipid-binding domain-containing protein [Kaistia nematophila]|uniref:Glycolipid-binding domain-containing protein n=1 Tax=Kaistia nematophila TaxID=2994654 RepID=A0A9X3E2U1_9HYPH|nr:putative glycolipid-binding domain-containing protein [Kaistia nematophila]MCX5568753.1 putative glycolipid-binding domain-containing protein [Kaistia nematophila]